MKTSKRDNIPTLPVPDMPDLSQITSRVENNRQTDIFAEQTEKIRQLVTELKKTNLICSDLLSYGERAMTDLEDATDEAKAIARHIGDAIKAAQNSEIQVSFTEKGLKDLTARCHQVIDEEKQVLAEHEQSVRKILDQHYNRISNRLNDNDGIYLSGRLAKVFTYSFWILFAYFVFTILAFICIKIGL